MEQCTFMPSLTSYKKSSPKAEVVKKVMFSKITKAGKEQKLETKKPIKAPVKRVMVRVPK